MKFITAALMALTLGSTALATEASAAPYHRHHKVCSFHSHRVHVGHHWVVKRVRVCR